VVILRRLAVRSVHDVDSAEIRIEELDRPATVAACGPKSFWNTIPSWLTMKNMMPEAPYAAGGQYAKEMAAVGDRLAGNQLTRVAFLLRWRHQRR
jgi:hypothetical protein